MSTRPSLFAELRRRNVFRVAAAYAVVAWLLIQAADIMLGNFGAPEWVFKSFVALLLLGFPLALFLSWAYELTPEGVKRAADVSVETSGSQAGKPIDWLILAGIAAVIAVTVADRVWAPPTPERVDASEEVSEAPPPEPAAPADREPDEEVFIAVLPFDDYSPDPADAYFAGGMTEEITSQLSRVSALRVVSRTAVNRALETQLSLAEIAETLGVEAVLEGSVRKSGDMIRITTQLVDAASGQHLWSTDYDRELADVFAIQREVALAIVRSLQAELSPGEQERIDTPPTDNLAAYQLFLRSREFPMAAIASNRTGIELLRQAVALDPEFSDAWARLSVRYTWAARLGDRDAVEEAFTTARRALELDPESQFGHRALAEAYAVSEEVEQVIASFERAIALYPDDHIALRDLSGWNSVTGQSAIGLAQATRALRLARNVPSVWWFVGTALMMLGDHQRLEDWLDLAAAEGLESYRLDVLRAWLLATQGQSREALEVVRGSRERWAGNVAFERSSASVQLYLGDYQDVRSFIERQAEIAPEDRSDFISTARVMFAQVLLEEGEADRAAALFEESLRTHEEFFDAGRGWSARWAEAATIHALQGRHEEALKWLQRAADAGWHVPDSLARDRGFAALHDVPRFQAIIAQMAEAQAAQRAKVEAEGIAAEIDAMIAAGLGRAARTGPAEARQ